MQRQLHKPALALVSAPSRAQNRTKPHKTAQNNNGRFKSR